MTQNRHVRAGACQGTSKQVPRGLRCGQKADECEGRDEGRSLGYDAEERDEAGAAFCRNPDGTEPFRAVCFVARLANGTCHWRRLASRIPSRKAAVATVRDLFRGSLKRLRGPSACVT